jgi:hypothetical protein
MERVTITVGMGTQTRISVTSDGAEEGTVFEGSERHTKRADAAAYNKDLIRLGDEKSSPIVRAGFDTALGLTAALFSIAPQDTYIIEAPKEVTDLLTDSYSTR